MPVNSNNNRMLVPTIIRAEQHTVWTAVDIYQLTENPKFVLIYNFFIENVQKEEKRQSGIFYTKFISVWDLALKGSILLLSYLLIISLQWNIPLQGISCPIKKGHNSTSLYIWSLWHSWHGPNYFLKWSWSDNCLGTPENWRGLWPSVLCLWPFTEMFEICKKRKILLLFFYFFDSAFGNSICSFYIQDQGLDRCLMVLVFGCEAESWRDLSKFPFICLVKELDLGTFSAFLRLLQKLIYWMIREQNLSVPRISFPLLYS